MQISELTADTMARSVRITLSYGATSETFVVTTIGRTRYAVSVQYGYAYTRPQLVEKYTKVGATVTTEANPPTSY